MRQRHRASSTRASSTRAYLARIERYPELSRARELELARAAVDQGDRRAAEELICAHLRDVVAIARAYQGYGHGLAQLIAVGNLGLVLALERFEPGRGLRFMTYASYWVRAEILAHVMASFSVVGLGRSTVQTRLFFGLRRERARLAAAGVEGPALIEALAAHFRCTEDRVELMLARLDQRDGAAELLDHEAAREGDPEQQLAQAERQRARLGSLGAALDQLDARERLIVERRLLAQDKPSRVELGRELGISRERVRQLELRACDKLRAQLEPVRAM